ncbi:hypothetical protein ACLBUY_26025, partial [Pseudomonas aeruginosa]
MTATGTASPVRANFPVRRMDFSFSETPKYWWDGQPFMTQWQGVGGQRDDRQAAPAW